MRSSLKGVAIAALAAAGMAAPAYAQWTYSQGTYAPGTYAQGASPYGSAPYAGGWSAPYRTGTSVPYDARSTAPYATGAWQGGSTAGTGFGPDYTGFSSDTGVGSSSGAAFGGMYGPNPGDYSTIPGYRESGHSGSD